MIHYKILYQMIRIKNKKIGIDIFMIIQLENEIDTR